jgi:hypothetical protein
MSYTNKGLGYFIQSVITVSSRTLSKDLKPRRLIREDDGVIGNAWFCACREDYGHEFANTFRLVIIILTAPLYYFLFYLMPTLNLAINFLRLPWLFYKIEAPDAVLYNPPSQQSREKGPYHPGQFKPRWILKVAYRGGRLREVRIVNWADEEKDILAEGYTALSYAYDNAKELFREKYPNITPEACIPSPNQSNADVAEMTRQDPIMTAWYQSDPNPDRNKKWYETALRQVNAKVFLDCYLDARCDHRDKNSIKTAVEYVWLDEFCLYDPARPSLEIRFEELARMSDIFGSASAVCIWCPRPHCGHVDRECAWGRRLWTLSEIVNADQITTLTRNRPDSSRGPWTLTQMPGRHFRSMMQREAEHEGQWHLHAIMSHANNGGSTTWQHSIHSLIVEAIHRNELSGYTNELLAKALNGLLPRRAWPKDLLGKDGWADLAWLLELNQGFYNSAALAAVCGLGETKAQGKGWLGPPIYPKAGNERLQPLVSAFPVPVGLFVLNPKVIGPRKKLKRDHKGMYRTKKLILFQVRP